MKDLVIIGAGPTGLYSAFLSGMNKLDAIVIEAAADLGGQVTLYKDKAIYDVPGFAKIDGGVIIDALHNQYMQYQDLIPILRDTQATQIIEHEDHYIIETTKGIINTKTILLANGGGLFKPKPLENVSNNQDYDNLYYHIDDIKQFKDKKVVILGGGDSAVDWALSFLSVTENMYLIHRRHDFRAHIGPVEKIKSSGKVLTPYVIKELICEGKNIKKIILEHTEDKTQKSIELDALMVFYGSILQRQEVDIWQVETDHKGIKVKSNMETSRKGIYAVGNSIYYPGKLRMIVTGLGEAATAIGAITNQLYPQRKNPYLVK